jgi:hypothetical protein
MDNKQPEMELLDMEFHGVVESNELITAYDSWSADCYNALVAYPRTATLADRRECCVRVAQAAREAAEIIMPTGMWLASIADNWARGIKGDRVAFNWMSMHWDTDVEDKYLAKALRHLAQADMAVNAENRIKHLAALFCNANILWRRCDGDNIEGVCNGID